ncbi:GlcNAc-domain-containing protein [Pelagophyceae sp. CCMP2097]|nr:GlcNAc-domain-containing protein [Pelagophyceae sp. CCMP2097]
MAALPAGALASILAFLPREGAVAPPTAPALVAAVLEGGTAPLRAPVAPAARPAAAAAVAEGLLPRMAAPLGPSDLFSLLQPGGPRYAVLDGVVGHERAAAAAAAAQRLHEAGALSRARVGQGAARRLNAAARGDDSAWVQEATAPPALAAVLMRMGQCRAQLAPGGPAAELHGGTLSPRTSSQLARYARHARYAVHRDVLQGLDDADDGSERRIFTAVYYLNREAAGGALRLYLPAGAWTADGAGYFDVQPKLDRLVIFDARLEHEVLPNLGNDRFALTQWWYGSATKETRAPPASVGVALPLPPPGAARADEKIFVSIASYRDRECQHTLRSLFAAAAKPGNVFVGVVAQYDPLLDVDCFEAALGDHARNVRWTRVDAADAAGPCPARATAETLYAGETYCLQIDSHMRFRKGWDAFLTGELARCGAERPVLTAYPVGYDLPNELAAETRPTLLAPSHFGAADGMLRMTGRVLRRRPAAPVASPLWCAGFSFSRAADVREVPYDPHLRFLFFGEEVSMAARLWTSHAPRGCDFFAPTDWRRLNAALGGCDFFAPTENVLYHLWARDARADFRTDARDAERARLDTRRSLRRVRALFGIVADGDDGDDSDVGPHLESFGLGTRRSLGDFERHAGIDLAGRRVVATHDAADFAAPLSGALVDQLQALGASAPPTAAAPPTRDRLDSEGAGWPAGLEDGPIEDAGSEDDGDPIVPLD